MMQGEAVSWETKRQHTVALSSTEAEFMFMTAAIQECIWLRRLEREWVHHTPVPMLLHCDKKDAIQIAMNNSYSSRTNHTDIRVKFIREKLGNGEVKLKYLDTNRMRADIFAKGIIADKYNIFILQFRFYY